MRLRAVAVALVLALLPVHTAEAAEPAALTVTFTDRAGTPASRAMVTMVNPGTNDYLYAESEGGTATIDAPPAAVVVGANMKWTFNGETRGAFDSVSTADAPQVSTAQLGSAQPHDGVHPGQEVTARTLTVDVSYDAGATWVSAPLRSTRTGWVTQVTPPRGAADISLRAHATDEAGNEVEQTMTRAIPLR